MAAVTSAMSGKRAADVSLRGYFAALLACGITTAIATPLREYFDLANIVMLFLLAIVLIGVSLGRGPAVMAAFLSVALFDFFFVPPRFSFAVSDAQYLLTFGVMLTVALIIGQLTASLKQQAELASIKEQRTRALYEMARELAGALTSAQVTGILRRFLRAVAHADAALLLPDLHGELRVVPDGDDDAPSWIESRMEVDPAPIPTAQQRERILERLISAETFEQFPLRFFAKSSGVAPQQSAIHARRAHRLLPASHQPGGAGLFEHGVQPVNFSRSHAPPEAREAIVTPALIGVGGLRASGELFDQPLLEHPADGTVERAGTELHLFVRASRDVLHDGVAVTVTVSQRHQNVEDGGGKGDEGGGVGMHIDLSDRSIP